VYESGNAHLADFTRYQNLGDIRNENLFVHPALKRDFLGMPLPKDFRTASAVIFADTYYRN
jgi:hypothetical protein